MANAASQDLAHLIRFIPAFRELEEADLDALGKALRERPVKAGEVIAKQGEVGHELFIVLEGEFQMYVRQEQLDFEKVIRRIGSGNYFGEITLLSGGPRTSSVKACTDGRIAALHQIALEDIMRRSPSLALALCKGMAQYVRTILSRDTGIPFVDLDQIMVDKAASALIPPKIAAYARAMPYAIDGDTIKVGMVDPYDAPSRTFLKEVLQGKNVEFAAISESDFERYKAAFFKEESDQPVPDAELEEMSYVSATGQKIDFGDKETGELMERVFRSAFKYGASDIHFEPVGERSRVRMRIDGNMIPIEDAVPLKLFSQVVSRLKVMSDMDITQRRLPQDGRFMLKAGPRNLETRVSIMPCKGGEKAVLRTLDPGKQTLTLDELIVSQPVAMQVRESFLSPNGLVLVCGPTGSGKTTTLYAGLMEIWRGSNTWNMVTIEDPIEYQLDFATQIQVNKAVGLDFPQILRSVLRQDPDIMLLGEIRDTESAEIAVEAGTTGHLVLSSLHTDSAIDAVVRLRQLGVRPYMIANALRCVIAQKLVPKICPACAQPVTLDANDKDRLTELGVIDASWSATVYRPQGCEKCRFTGTKGRVGVYEVLMITPKLRDAIERSASYTDMQAALTHDQFIPMARYARFLLENKMVSVDEIKRLFPVR
jgi:type II secretory ATPase GspE/PulE/Tfp pilus assembly ATPase PilB-like protein